MAKACREAASTISRARAVAIVWTMVWAIASTSRLAIADPLVDGLATDDPKALDAAVTAVEHAPADADALFAAGRACEDRLVAPARALALYERIARELPSARVAQAAEHRAATLRGQVGDHGEHAREGAELAAVIADAGKLAALRADGQTVDDRDVIARATRLADAHWPGAPDAAVWLADWLRSAGRFDDARARYATVVATWPGTTQAATARRGEAAAAIDAHAWSDADRLVDELPAIAPEDRVLRDELALQVAKGRRGDRLYLASWLAVVIVLLGLLASVIEAGRRARKRPSFKPPIEVLFLAPVIAVVIAVSFTAHQAIAPAVTIISLGGLACAWLSGASLERLRDEGRPLRLRAVVQVLGCIVAVVALIYIAMTRDGLVDLLMETIRVGPE